MNGPIEKKMVGFVLVRKRLLVISLLFFLLTTFAHSKTIDKRSGNIAAEEAAGALLKRVLPNDTDYFIFESIPAEKGKDLFEIESKKGKIVISGNNGVSMASGLNWYLKNHCRCHISLNGSQLNLPDPLPMVKPKVRISSPFKYRNFFNYCTFSYTMAWWNWERWEKMIDYMALNGMNMPLAVTGQEAVWQEVYRELGLSDLQIRDFLPGPAYLPWGWMGNIDGLAGPLPQDWIDSHTKLQQKILARERELGMTPILQGFTGHVPAAIKELFPEAKIHQTTRWAGMPGTWFLDPQDPLFQRVGRSFIEKQTRRFGTDHLYDADCFNEVNPPTNDPLFITNMGKSVYQVMQTADPEAVWVFQGWFLFWQADFWKPPQARALLEAVPDGETRFHMLGLDLYAESQPVWKKTGAFYGKPWVWNVLCHLGQKVTMGGDLFTMQKNLVEALESKQSGKLCGIGMMMEGLGYNPIIQEFITGKTWKPGIVDLQKWAADYALRRYGSREPGLQKAWQLLVAGPYSRDIVRESFICLTPRLRELQSEGFGVGYDAHKAARACQLLLDCADENKNKTKLTQLKTFRFDLTHVTREMLVNLANRFNHNIFTAYKQKDAGGMVKNGELFLQLIRDLDELLGTNQHFLLGRWIADARKWGKDEKEKDFYEWNARTIITLWEPAKKSQLRDYASKQWSGLLKDFYLPRWQLYLEQLHQSLMDNRRFSKKKFFNDLREMELAWTQRTDQYPSEPRGDTLEVSRRLFRKYISYYNK